MRLKRIDSNNRSRRRVITRIEDNHKGGIKGKLSGVGVKEAVPKKKKSKIIVIVI